MTNSELSSCARCVRLGFLLSSKHQLRNAIAVAQMNKDDGRPGRAAGAPSPSTRRLAGIAGAQFAAAVRAAQIAQKI